MAQGLLLNVMWQPGSPGRGFWWRIEHMYMCGWGFPGGTSGKEPAC